jgi:branched-chain amino acid transport system ATP-binding protein
MLQLEDVTAGYGSTPVLHGVSLSVPDAAVVSLVGANGAGKTTLARVISGLLPERGGRILFGGKSITPLSPGARLALGIAHVPEGRQVFAGLSVADNLRLGAFCRRDALSKAALASRIDEVIASFPDLRTRLSDPAGNLSGGQQQMLAIARALMSGPQLIVLDEPSLGLSPRFVAGVFRLIGNLRRSGIAVLLSEQNARLSLAIADHGYVVERGRITLSGPGPELLRHEEIVERYLGIGHTGRSAPEDALAQRALTERLAALLALS